MTRDRNLLIAALLILGVAAVAFALFLRDGEVELGPSPGSAEEAGDTERPDAGHARRTTPLPDAPPASPIEVVPDLPLHVPVHDERVRSGRARAEFEIVDARQQPLPDRARLHARLYRVEDGIGLWEHAEVDQKRGLVTCAGRSGGGLEPGDYALKITAGPYGGFWKDFSVAAGQLVKQRLSVDTWTRVVRIRFETPSGEPLDRIPIRPTYAVDDVKVPNREFRKPPSRLLREPPGKEETGAIGVGGGGASGSASGRPRSWLTRSGSWFMQVVAGAPGRFHLTASKSRHGLETVDVTSSFEGSEWDGYRIVLNLTAREAERLERYRPGNPEDPGQESELAVTGDGAVARDPGERPPTLSEWTRVVFRSETPRHVKLEAESPSFSHSHYHDGRSYQHGRPRKSGAWFVDVALARVERLKLWWTDGSLYESEPRVLERKDVDIGQRVVERRDTLAFFPLTVELDPVSPTFDGWAASVSAVWSDSRAAESIWRARRHGRSERKFRIETALRLDDDGRAVFGRSLRLRFLGDASGSACEVRVPWTTAMSRDAADGHVRLRPEPEGLVLRAVDEAGRGLPWVEGTLMELSELRRAQHIRRALAGAGVTPDARTDFLSVDVPREVHRDVDHGADPEAIEELLGEEISTALADAESRRRLARNGAWYDPWRRVRSDARGYVLGSGLKPVPGRRYVLWLWSRSRDANEPDRRIVFRAEDGLTDLGVIELPRPRAE